MDCVPVRRRIFQPDIALEETPGDEVLRLPGGAAVFDARRERAPTAAVDADLPVLLKASLRVQISSTPEVRRPNCGGSAPVISDMFPIKAVSRKVPKPLTPSGSMMPLMRTCTLACSLRTW